MWSRAWDCIFWLGITGEIEHTGSHCSTCATTVPSQPHMPPSHQSPPVPISGHSHWLFHTSERSEVRNYGGQVHLLVPHYEGQILRQTSWFQGTHQEVHFRHLRRPRWTEQRWWSWICGRRISGILEILRVVHRLSAAYNFECNGRAEVGVKSMNDESLDDNRVIADLLQYRNTPDPSTGMSPAAILVAESKTRFPYPLAPPRYSRTHMYPRYGSALGKPEGKPYAWDSPGRWTPLDPTPRPWPPHARCIRGVAEFMWSTPQKVRPDRTGTWAAVLRPVVVTHGSGRVVRRNRRHLHWITTLKTHPGCNLGPAPHWLRTSTGTKSPTEWHHIAGPLSHTPPHPRAYACVSPDTPSPTATQGPAAPPPPHEASTEPSEESHPEPQVEMARNGPTGVVGENCDSQPMPPTSAWPRWACIGKPMYWETDYVKH